ncbi:DUF6455 family protein [Dongia sedimenti]|uniref:DUF6455 family protein n=1 Tax=Dongia sedimenti TaxID=3064282 RepID=A0ABU0YEC2_9PROT|nr:DUF6455 family protein [Rhodospirillaceae bacterium R-7]
MDHKTALNQAPPKEMAAMMLTIAVDPEKMATDWGRVQLQHAVRRCHGCSALYTCRYWLGDAHRNPRAFREFCPNAGLLERFRGDRRGKARQTVGS